MLPPLGGISGGLFGGGRNLGAAHGTITIDTGPARQAAGEMQGIGRQIERSLGGVGRGVDAALSRLDRFSRGLRSIRGELLAFGAAGGLLTGLGLRTAGSLEEAQVLLRGMVGSEREAVRLMEQLNERAQDARVPFADMLSVATQMLPTLEGNTEELEKWFDLVRRTAVLNRREGLAGAAFSIREAMVSGGTDLVSLAERFNISRIALREAMEETGGDFAAALDLVLTRMGITTETADEMGKTFNAAFRSARDAALQALAAGFAPFLDDLTDILTRTRDWLNELRQTRPAALQAGASVAAIAAVGAPGLVFLNQTLEALRNLQRLGVIRVGLVVGVAAGVAFAAREGVRGVGRVRGDDELANITFLGMLQRAVKALVDIFFSGAVLMGGGFNAILEAIAGFLQGMGGVIQRLSDFVPDFLGGDRLRQTGEDIADFGQRLEEANDFALGEFISQMNTMRTTWHGAIDDFANRLRGVELGPESRRGGERGRGRPAAEEIPGFTDEQTQAIRDWHEEMLRIEREAGQQRAEATRQHEAQRTRIIAQYELQRTREAEDFARQRARAEAQLEADIAAIRAEQVEREVEAAQELQERLAEIQEDAARQRERMEQDHRDNLLSAASRLDARAVAEENRRFNRQMSRFEEDLQQRIVQEQEAHEERLQQAREADEERIADMRAAFERQQRLEDEDRAIRLRRMEEDHQRQLAELGEAHRARLAQINRQATEERSELNRAFQEQLIALGLHNSNMLSEQRRRQAEALAAFEGWWDDMIEVIEADTRGAAGRRQPNHRRDRQSGGRTTSSRGLLPPGEAMVDESTANLLRSGLGQTFVPGQRTSTRGGDRPSIIVERGGITIPIYATPSQSEAELGREVEKVLTRVFEELAA